MAHTHYTVGEGYSSAAIQTAIDLIPGDLSDTGGGVQNVDVYYKDADDHSVAYAETLDISGFSNGAAADYIDVGAMVSHGGMRDSGVIVDVSSAAVEDGIYIQASYTRFHGFCVNKTTYRAAPYWNSEFRTSAGSHIRISDNIIYGCETAAGAAYGIRHNTVGGLIYNNIFMDIGLVSHSGIGIELGASSTLGNELGIHNNVLINCDYRGFLITNKDYINISNNYVYAVTYPFADAGAAHNTFNYNISSNGTADDFGGTGNLVNKAAADQFECVTAGSEDLRLKQGSKCNRKGQDNSALFTTDITGATRVNWNCGAFEKFPATFRGGGSKRDGRHSRRTWV